MAIPENVLDLLASATPDDVRFIKLGRQSSWWSVAKETNTLRIGFRNFDFELCRAGKWDEAKAAFTARGDRQRASDNTRAVNQVRAFFELPESTLWVTVEDGDVWWCFAKPGIEDLYADHDDEAEDRRGARLRHAVDCWRNVDIEGDRLRLDSMTTKITKVASFQETICKPDGASDLLRRIRRIQSEGHARTSQSLGELTTSVGDLLDQLHQDDFELLIELIFSSSGWRRVSPLGGIQKTWDLALALPTTGEHCFVQVKSQTNRTTFRELVTALKSSEGYARLFFAYHTPATPFENEDAERVTVWHRYEIARQAIRAGLVDWILLRTT